MAAPYKRWSVAVEGKPGVPFRGQSAAYEYVRQLGVYGDVITVHHWEDGGWRLYERCEPLDTASLAKRQEDT